MVWCAKLGGRGRASVANAAVIGGPKKKSLKFQELRLPN